MSDPNPPILRGADGVFEHVLCMLDAEADSFFAKEMAHCDLVRNADATVLQRLQAGQSQGAGNPAGILQVVDGVAFLEITGPMSRDPNIYQVIFDLPHVGTSQYEQAVHHAIDDPDIHTLFTCVRSPGGQVSGVAELSDAIHKAGETMRTICYADSSAYSPAYWIGCQHKEFFAGRNTGLGSIGTFARLCDSSQWAENVGIKYRVIKSTELKGGAVDGVPISDATVAEFQRFVDATNNVFVGDVMRGRNISESEARSLADARLHVGEAARKLNLVDGISDSRTLWKAAVGRQSVNGSASVTVLPLAQKSEETEPSSETNTDDSTKTPTAAPNAQFPIEVDGKTVLVEARPLATPRTDGATHWAVHPQSGDPCHFQVAAIQPTAPESTPQAAQEAAKPEATEEPVQYTDEERKAAVGALVGGLFKKVQHEAQGGF